MFRWKADKFLWTPSLFALVVVNLIPLWGIVFLGWSVFSMLLLFWLENVIIGFYNVLRMICVRTRTPLEAVSKIFIIPFFCVHYGIFTFVHGLFIMVLFGPPDLHLSMLQYVASVGHFITDQGIWFGVIGLVLSHGFSFVSNYLAGGEYKRLSLGTLMHRPYGRVVVLHLVIMAGGFLLLTFGSPVAGSVVLIVLKIVIDMYAHLREHRRRELVTK